MKIETTIESEYVLNWNVEEGIREMVQNGKDAEVEFNAPFKVRWAANVLRIENTGCTLARDALLLGKTSKRDRDDMIGKWGEGLTLGLLALTRAGRDVKIRSGGEVWIPRLETSARFPDAKVLVIEVLANRKFRNRVCVEIAGVDKDEWDAIRPRFLFLERPRNHEVIPTPPGDLLLADRHRGMLFIKGIFVEFDQALTHGYNYHNATYDRDRKMVGDFDKRWNNAKIWRSAVASHPDRLFKTFYTLLDAAARDVEGVSEYVAESLPEEIVDRAVAEFEASYGKNAIPVQTLGQSREIEHLGKNGIVTSTPLQTVLAQKVGSLDEVKRALSSEILRCYSWYELTDIEKASLTDALALLDPVAPCSLDDIDVVDFRSASLQGQFKSGRLAIARRELENRDETLLILVHEVAHRDSSTDGTKVHVAKIEEIWSGIVGRLRDVTGVC